MVAGDYAVGLQHTASLEPGAGMAFIFDPPRTGATFHMGRVGFPIDIVFVSGGRVAKVVHNAQPGTRERWACADPCELVVELPGRTAARVSTGQVVTVADDGYRPTDDGEVADRIRLPNDALASQHVPHDERYKQHGTPDEADPNADEMAPELWHQQLSWDPNRPITAQRIADPVDFIMAIISRIAGQPSRLEWHRDALNPRLSYASIGPRLVQQWIGSNDPDIATVLSSDQAMQTLGDGMVLAGIAQIAHVAHGNEGPLLILWRQTT